MRICILGATGLVGRETLALADRAWPGAELLLYASRDQDMMHAGRTLAVQAASALEHDDAARGDLAFVALDDEHSLRYVPRLRQLGYKVVDKSNTYRLDPRVPLVVSGVNCGRVTHSVDLVANPNCTTIPLALAVQPLASSWELASVTVSSYQAISGAGGAALDAFLEASATGYGERSRLGTQFDAASYAGNTVPHSGKTDASGFSAEERKLMAESRKILELPALPVVAQCCRVAVAVGHYLNVWVTLARPTTPRDVERRLEDAPFVRLLPGSSGEGLSALHGVHERDVALVGRVRNDPTRTDANGLCLTVTADNLRLGAATNAVRIASRWFASADPSLQAPGQQATA